VTVPADSAFAENRRGVWRDGHRHGHGRQVDGSYRVNARAVAVATGQVIATASVTFVLDGGPERAEGRTLEVQLRRLADRVASSLEKLDGDLRYQQIAVLPSRISGARPRIASSGCGGRRADHGAAPRSQPPARGAGADHAGHRRAGARADRPDRSFEDRRGRQARRRPGAGGGHGGGGRGSLFR